MCNLPNDLFPLHAEAPDLLCHIIGLLGIEDAILHLIAHKARINWRQIYTTTTDKLMNLDSGLIQDKPHKSWKIVGSSVSSKLPQLINYVNKENLILSLCSHLKLPSGDERHLLIMNLHPEPELTEEDILNVIRFVTGEIPGYLLKTARYYHFYGRMLLKKSQWIKMISQFLMPTIIVSPRYIGHSLYRGYTTVRLTQDKDYKPVVPKVVRIV